MERKRRILSKNAQPIVHMRQRKRQGRFGLVFGSGVSQSFGCPSWGELLRRIAADERVDGLDIMESAGDKTSVSQLLYQKFRSNLIEGLGSGYDKYDKLSSYIKRNWHQVVHDSIYQDVPREYCTLKSEDPYLGEFIEIIKNTKLTINYNFDNIIQTLIAGSRTQEEREKTRGYRTVWSADVQFYPEDSVIYHPNGYLPRDFNDKPSDELIFLEDSFGDQLIESATGHYAALSYHLAQNTCLLIGLSLDDSTLKHLLRKNAKHHPGHVHYYVHYTDGDQLSDDERRAIREANFEVYNLVTLFLNKEEIATLGRLLTVGTEHLERLADRLGVRTTYRHFLTGSVCVGKSTAVSHFRSLATHDEWFEKRVSGMEKDPEKVDDPEKINKIDEWVADQWHKKNFNLSRSDQPGIHIIDRCALDAFSFTPEDEWVQKAEFTESRVTPENSNVELCPGNVILMVGDPNVMSVRALKLQKDVDPEQLEYRQSLLKIVYDDSVNGVTELDTRDKSIKKVAKEICRCIHLHDYEECDLQRRLEKIKDGEVSPSQENSNSQ